MFQNMVTPVQGSGGEVVEKIWENPSPSSSFDGDTYNLISGKKISDYRYIKVEWKVSTTTSQTMHGFILIKTDDFVNYQGGVVSGVDYVCPTMGSLIAASSSFTLRNVIYSSDTTIRFSNCMLWKSGTTGSLTNSSTIPLAVYGIK